MRKIVALLLAFAVLFPTAAHAQQYSGARNFGQTCPGAGALCRKTPVATGCSYPLPIGSDAVVGAYSFRKLYSSYAGKAVNLERTSDSTAMDIGFASNNCDFDTATATTFCAATTCKIKIWYDQSGSGNNVSQSTVGNQPPVTLNCINSQPCAVYNGTPWLQATLGSGVGSDTFVAVAEWPTTLQGFISAVYTSTTDYTGIFYSGGSSACADAREVANTAYKGTEACSTGTIYSIVGTNNATASNVYLNGTAGTQNTTSVAPTASSIITIGGSSAGAGSMVGDISEMILFAPDISSTDSGVLSTNQRSYW